MQSLSLCKLRQACESLCAREHLPSRCQRSRDLKVCSASDAVQPSAPPREASLAAPAAPIANPPLPPASPYIYEPTYGLPVVRRRLNYAELLKDIRGGRVKEVKWFKDDAAWMVDGPCLVVYKNGKLAQANVPIEDVRVRVAMESHGVHNRRLASVPTDEDLKPPREVGDIGQAFLRALPFLSIFAIWSLVQAKNIMKGDASDRAQIKRKAEEDKREMNRQRIEDEKVLNISKMVANNYTDEMIRKDAKKMGLDFTEDEMTALLAEARKSERLRRAGKWSLEEEEEALARSRQAAVNKSAMEGSEEESSGLGVGRMHSMKIRKAKLRSVNRTRMRGKLKNLDDEDIFFEDVAGIDEAKQELQEVVDFFNLPERFAKSGARAPRGVLLYGPPGTGKTLLARAVAGEADATFVGVNASEFVEMFVGVGAARVRDLFQTARENAPAVIFIDEIDAVGRIRGGSQGNDERDQTLNQLLSEMDGFDERSGIVIIAATNRRDVLDPALIRPGRFDRQVNVGLPNLEGRIEVLKVHLNRRKWDEDGMRLTELAFETQQYSGAMIANLVNIAALTCARDGRDMITHEDMEAALDVERVGARKDPYAKSVTKRLAVVEGATALVATLLPVLEQVVRVSTRPSEKAALGQTVLKVNEQRELNKVFTKRYLEAQLLMVLAGRAAERLLLGEDEVSSLNARNFGFARRIVNKLVVSNAMSDNPAIGPRTISSPSRSGMQRSMAQIVQSRVSSVSHASADFEMESLLAQADKDVYDLLERNRRCLEVVVEKLSAAPYELDGEEMERIVAEHANADDLRQRQEGLELELI